MKKIINILALMIFLTGIVYAISVTEIIPVGTILGIVLLSAVADQIFNYCGV